MDHYKVTYFQVIGLNICKIIDKPFQHRSYHFKMDLSLFSALLQVRSCKYVIPCSFSSVGLSWSELVWVGLSGRPGFKPRPDHQPGS